MKGTKMNKEEKAIEIIYIEDESEFHGEMVEQAANYNIKLTPFIFGEEAFEKLNTSVHQGMILDVRGRWNKTDSEERSLAFNKCLNELKDIKTEKNIEIPWAVYTAFSDDVDHFLDLKDQKNRVFRKGERGEVKRLFTQIIKLIKEQPMAELKLNYGEVLDVINKDYVDKSKSEIVIKILLNQHNQRSSDQRVDIYTMRPFIEDACALMMRVKGKEELANGKDLGYHIKWLAGFPRLVGEEIISDGRTVFLKNFIRTKPENNWMPFHIYSHLTNLQHITNQFLHAEKDDDLSIPCEPSKFTWQSLLNSLCEVIVWMGKFMDINQSSKELKQDK